jgi:hypothetical protein
LLPLSDVLGAVPRSCASHRISLEWSVIFRANIYERGAIYIHE